MCVCDIDICDVYICTCISMDICDIGLGTDGLLKLRGHWLVKGFSFVGTLKSGGRY